MGAIYTPSFFDPGDRAVVPEEIDEAFSNIARSLNGGLDVRNIKRGTKFSIGATASTVQNSFLEPGACFTMSITLESTGALTTNYVGSVPHWDSSDAGYMLFAKMVVANSVSTTGTVTIKAGGVSVGTMSLAAVSPRGKYGEDAANYLSEAYTTVFTATVAKDAVISIDHPAITGYATFILGLRAPHTS